MKKIIGNTIAVIALVVSVCSVQARVILSTNFEDVDFSGGTVAGSDGTYADWATGSVGATGTANTWVNGGGGAFDGTLLKPEATGSTWLDPVPAEIGNFGSVAAGKWMTALGFAESFTNGHNCSKVWRLR